MNKRQIYGKLMALILGFAMIMQSGFVVPVFADETEYSVTLHYMISRAAISYLDEGRASTWYYSGVIGAANPMIVPPGTSDDTVNRFLSVDWNDGTTAVTVGGSLTPDEPLRVSGYRFDGWYYNLNFKAAESELDPFDGATKFNGTVTSEMVSGNTVNLYAHWVKYDAPYINDKAYMGGDAVKFIRKNEYGEYITEPVVWTSKNGEIKDIDGDGNPDMDFVSDTKDRADTSKEHKVEEYYGYVYGDVDTVQLIFEQRENCTSDSTDSRLSITEAQSSIKYNGEAVSADTSDITIGTIPDYSSEDTSHNYRACVGSSNGGPMYMDTYNEETLADYNTRVAEYRQTMRDSGYSEEEIEEGISREYPAPVLVDEDKFRVSKQYTTEYLKLNLNEDFAEDTEYDDWNTFEITVNNPQEINDVTDLVDSHTKTYRFHIKRVNYTLTPENGNTPYGQIYSSRADLQQGMKNSFDNEYRLSGTKYYNKAAWNIYHDPDSADGGDAVEVPIGSDLKEKEYINYDKDRTAIVVTSGDKFADPGIFAYKGTDKLPLIFDGEDALSLDENKGLTRKITYTTIDGLRYENWNGASQAEKVLSTRIANPETDNVIKILEWNKDNHEYVKPDIYTIDYYYTPWDGAYPMHASRKMIVIPKQQTNMPFHFDVNFDNYFNALDALIYNITPRLNESIIDNFYIYRVLDIAPEGTIKGKLDSADKEYFKSYDMTSENLYPSLAVEGDTIPQKRYEAGAEATDKAQLYMDYLGKDKTKISDIKSVGDVVKPSSDASEEEKNAAKLNEGDIFYIGYRFKNVHSVDDLKEALEEITFSTGYDRRYVRPATTNINNLLKQIKNINPQLEDKYDIAIHTEDYSTDSTVAFEKWNNIDDVVLDELGNPKNNPTGVALYDAEDIGNTSQVSVQVVEMHLKDGQDLKLLDDMYLLKLPMIVVKIPPKPESFAKAVDKDGEEHDVERQILSLKLGANALSLATGTNSYGYMWDTNDTLNNVSKNLMDILQYYDNFDAEFGEEKAPIEYEVEYKSPFTAIPVTSDDGKAIFEGKLPEGVHYDPVKSNVYTDADGPQESGTFNFYIGGQSYRLIVKPRKMRVTVAPKNDAHMTYGDENPPEFVLTFNSDDFAKNDTEKNQNFRADNIIPKIQCEADKTTDTGEVDIKLSLNENQPSNYEFVLTDGTLIIDPRIIEISSIANVPTLILDTDDVYTAGQKLDDLAFYIEQSAYAGKTFTVKDDRIINGDNVKITFQAEYGSNKSGDEYNVTVNDIDIDSTFGKGYNYTIKSGNTVNTTGKVIKGEIITVEKGFEPQTEYTYGDLINLNSGLVNVIVKTSNASDYDRRPLTYSQLMKYFDLYLYDKNTGTEVKIDENYMPTYADNGKVIRFHYNDNSLRDTYGITFPAVSDTGQLNVNKQALKVKAVDKYRDYGDDNTTVKNLYTEDNDLETKRTSAERTRDGNNFTYKITGGKIIKENPNTHTNMDTEADILGYVNIKFEAVGAEQDINPEKRENNRPSYFKITPYFDGTINENYSIEFEAPYYEGDDVNGDYIEVDGSKLEIRPRDIVVHNAEAPVLTAPYYINADGTVKTTSDKIRVYGYAGDDVTETDNKATAMTINDGRWTDRKQPIKIWYDVQYKDTTNQNSPEVVAWGIDFDDTEDDNGKPYKSWNYNITAITNAIKGKIDTRRITDIEVIRDPKTDYVYGEEFVLDKGNTLSEHLPDPMSDEFKAAYDAYDENKNWIRVTYDSGEVSDISLEDIYNKYTTTDYNDNYNKKGGTDFGHNVDLEIITREKKAEDTSTATGEVKNSTQINTFMPSFNQNSNHLNVNDYKNDGIALRLTAQVLKDSSDRNFDGNDFEKKEFTWPLVITKKRVEAWPNDKTITYTEDALEEFKCSYQRDDFAWGDADNIITYNHDNTDTEGNNHLHYTCLEDDNKTQVSNKTPAGRYTVTLEIDDTDNYWFDTEGKSSAFNVRQKPLVINKITIADLSSKEAFEEKLFKGSNEILSNNSGIEFAEGYAPIYDEVVRFTYDYTYNNNERYGTDDEAASVTLSNVLLDRYSYNARNYYLQSVKSAQNGKVISAYLTKLEIAKDGKIVDKDDNDTQEYKYGDKLDISGMRFNLYFDSGDVDRDVTFDKLESYGVKAVYCDENGNYDEAGHTDDVKLDDDTFLTLGNNDDYQYNGKHIRLVLIDTARNSGHDIEGDENIAAGISNNAIKVERRPVHVIVNDTSYTYGDTPPQSSGAIYRENGLEERFTYSLRASDFPQNTDNTIETKAHVVDNIETAGYNYNPPVISAVIGLDAPTAATNATTYRNAISADVTGAGTDNYVFVYDENDRRGTLTVNKRMLTISTGIDDVNAAIIPHLTAELAVNAGGVLPIVLEPNPNPVKVSETNQENLKVDHIVNGDELTFTFDVNYNSTEYTKDAVVDITNFKFDENNARNKNYTFDEDRVPTKAHGEIITRKILKIEFVSQPKLEYEYGEWLDVSAPCIKITYTSGETPVVTIPRLDDYNLNAKFVKKETDGTYTDMTSTLGVVRNNVLLTADRFNGIQIMVSPNESEFDEELVEGSREDVTAYSEQIEITPHEIRVTAENKEMTYGDDASERPAYTYRFNTNDLVNGDTTSSARFTLTDDQSHYVGYMYSSENGTKEGTRVNDKTPVGTYVIGWDVPDTVVPDNTKNYKPVFENGSLSIVRKEIILTKVFKIPELTPAIVAQHYTITPITIEDQTAKYKNPDNTSELQFDPSHAPETDDEVGITYNVIYDSIQATANTDVKIDKVRFDRSAYTNYFLTVNIPNSTVDGGVIGEEAISWIEITKDPVMAVENQNQYYQFTYGDHLNLDGDHGTIIIHYNNNTQIQTSFKDLYEASNHELDLEYVDSDGHVIDDIGKPTHDEKLYVNRHNGRHIRIKIDYNKYPQVNFRYLNEPSIGSLQTKALVVNKKELTVTAKSRAEVTGDGVYWRYYGDSNPELYYTLEGFVDDENENSANYAAGILDGFRAPVIYCEADAKSPVKYNKETGEYGTYGIIIDISDAISDNYSFRKVDSEIEIHHRPLDVYDITGGIPVLTSKIMTDQPGELHRLSGSALNTAGQLLLGNLFNDDPVRVKYTAVYSTVEEARNVEVELEDVTLDDETGKGANYVLRTKPVSARGGNVFTTKISRLTITKQPKLEYTYGEYLDLSEKGVRIEYDNDMVVENIGFDELESIYGVDVLINYKDENGQNAAKRAAALNESEPKQRLNVDMFNNAYLTLSPQYNMALASVQNVDTQRITVNRKTLNVYTTPVSSIYGTDPKPRFAFTYGEDFVYGETPEMLRTMTWNGSPELTDPRQTCLARSGGSVDGRTEVGTYVIKSSDAAARNYTFVYHDAPLVIAKHKLVVANIVSGIPELTANIIRENPGVTHVLHGTAQTAQMSCSVINNDDIQIEYDAVYSEETENYAYDIPITNMKLTNNYGRNRNYELAVSESVKTVKGGGKIYDKEIESIELTKQPKLEYTYGERLDLSGGEMHVVYDTGFEETFSLDTAADHRIELTYSQPAQGYVFQGDRLTVPLHNNARIIMRARTVLNVEPITTDALIVIPKVLNININAAESVYGEDPFEQFTFSYGNDFEYDETAESLILDGKLTAPRFVCNETDSNTSVSKTSQIGYYNITMQGAEAENYTARYNDNTLSIVKRVIRITDISRGIPALTADVIRANPGAVHKLEALGNNSELTVENVVNDGDIRVKYYAVYESEAPAEQYDVKIEYISMDDTYGRSGNYSIAPDSIAMIQGGGKIFDKEIESVAIKTQPKLEYTYGDSVDLSGGVIHIVYDTGFEEDISFDDAAGYGIAAAYTDTESTAAKTGDKVTVPFHNGVKIEVTAPSSVHTVSPAVSEQITVQKRVLEFSDITVEPIVYDGNTTDTEGVITFANPQNGDNVTATATFTFADENAGTDKLVNVTDIKLNSPFDENYELPATETTATGTIEKAVISPVLNEEDITVSTETNNITITAPELTEEQQRGGARYEYSIDGGETWQSSNEFKDIALGESCSVCVRIAETDNYKRSEPTVPIDVKAYDTKITLATVAGEGDGESGLKTLYTNKAVIESEDKLRELINAPEITYYGLYSDKDGTEPLSYPLTVSGDTRIYTSLIQPPSPSPMPTMTPRPGYNGGGGGGGGTREVKTTASPSPVPSGSPTASPSVEATATPSAEASPLPTQNPHSGDGKTTNKPYLHGFENLIRPDDYMSRAEAATLMVILKGETGSDYENVFPDVGDDAWYEPYISEGYARGLISGFDDGLFYPEDVVTREQFASMVLRLQGITESENTVSSFADVSDTRWSIGYINAAVEHGIIAGYDDGLFYPENPIRRSEAVRMINAATGRIPDMEIIDTLTCPYTDLPKSHWAYYEIMIASVEF